MQSALGPPATLISLQLNSKSKKKRWMRAQSRSLLFFKSPTDPAPDQILPFESTFRPSDLGNRHGQWGVAVLGGGREMVCTLLFPQLSTHGQWMGHLLGLTTQLRDWFRIEIRSAADASCTEVPDVQVCLSRIFVWFETALGTPLCLSSLPPEIGLLHIVAVDEAPPRAGQHWLALTLASQQQLQLGCADADQLKKWHAQILLAQAEQRKFEASYAAQQTATAVAAATPTSLVDAALPPPPPQQQQPDATLTRVFWLGAKKDVKSARPIDWSKRYITIADDQLRVYKTATSKNPRVSLRLLDDRPLVCQPLPNWTNQLTKTVKVPLHVSDGDQSFVLAWKSEADRAVWLDRLQAKTEPSVQPPAAPAPAPAALSDADAGSDQAVRKNLFMSIPVLTFIVAVLIVFGV